MLFSVDIRPTKQNDIEDHQAKQQEVSIETYNQLLLFYFHIFVFWKLLVFLFNKSLFKKSRVKRNNSCVWMYITHQLIRLCILYKVKAFKAKNNFSDILNFAIYIFFNLFLTLLSYFYWSLPIVKMVFLNIYDN